MAKKVFFGLSGGMGPALRCFPIAEQFRKRGAEIFFSIYSDSSARFLQKKGYTFLRDDDPTMPASSKLIDSNSAFYDLDHYYAQNGMLDETFANSWVDHRIEMLRRLNADIIFADLSPHTVIAGHVLKKPVVSITQSCFHPAGERIYSWGNPPRNLPKVTPIFNRMLEKHNLPVISRMEELNNGTINFVPGIPEMDPIVHEKTYYVGPIGVDWRSNSANNTSNPAVYPIVINTGRLYDSAGPSGLRLLEIVYEAFKNGEYPVLLAFQGKLPWGWKKKLTRSSIKPVPYFSSRDLSQCQLFIHHGGHGSCLSAIMHGIPSLILPTHNEREYNARRVAKLGVGEYMLPGNFTPDHLYQMANYLIKDSYKDKAVELRNLIISRNYRGAEEVYEKSHELAVLYKYRRTS